MNKNDLFEFDNRWLHPCAECSDEGIQENETFGLPRQDFVLPRNDTNCGSKSAGKNLPPRNDMNDENIKTEAHLPPHNDIILIGTDEAGRGPGAGGVFAAAVCFANHDKKLIAQLSDLNDSKQLSKKKREELYDIILENTINSTVCIEVEEIESINILNASLKAMKIACENVIDNLHNRVVTLPSQRKNILVLVDGNKLIKNFNYQQNFIIKGDSKSASIAAASILAKVSRDRYMEKLHAQYPNYNWIKNAGYLTKEHIAAIEKYGITPHHRKSFLKKIEAKQLSLLN